MAALRYHSKGLLPAGAEVIVGPYKVLEKIKHDELVSIEGADEAETTDDASTAEAEAEAEAETAAPQPADT